MPYNLLLLPLLGGFIFIRMFFYTKFSTSKLSGQRLIIWAAVAGILFIIISRFVELILIEYCPNITDFWWKYGLPSPYSGTAFLAFILGAVLWLPLNFFSNREGASKWSIENYGSRLEVLFFRAQEENKQIMVSLSDGKVYVGFIVWQPPEPHSDVSYFGILPTISGFRDSKTKEIAFVTDYFKIYERLDDTDDEGTSLLKIDDFEKYLKISSIETASIYDPDVFLMFNSNSENEEAEK